MDISSLFPTTYVESRQWFRGCLENLKTNWPDSKLDQHRVSVDEDISIDWIYAPATERPERLLVFTSGEHGIEGYVGAAVLRLLIEEFSARLTPSSTGLLLVHAINPWGMKYFRKVNRYNVDLNRNFILDWDTFRPESKDYLALKSLLEPGVPLNGALWQVRFQFIFQVLRGFFATGSEKIRRAALSGQYIQPQGIYFGGLDLQEETAILLSLYRQVYQDYQQIVHLDAHTGFGPRYQMSIYNSRYESRNADDLARQYQYPLVGKTDGLFAIIYGDMIDCIYELIKKEMPGKHVYAASFEFGTFGDGSLNQIRSLQAMVMENQVNWHGAGSDFLRKWVGNEFRELYLPMEARWREKAMLDARQALAGILQAEGYL